VSDTDFYMFIEIFVLFLQTDLIRDKVIALIRNRDKTRPFFYYVAPHAPHSPTIPAERHKNLFNNTKAHI